MLFFPVFVATIGEVATRFKVRGWSGDRGVESDLRNDLWAPDRGPSLLGPCRLEGVAGGGGLEASVRDLMVRLIMCVASDVRSFVLSVSAALDAVGVVFVLDFAGCFVGLVAGFELEEDGSKTSGSRSFLSVTTVAEVQVVVEATAVLTASTCACNEAM